MATEELTLVINDAQLNLALTKLTMIKTARTRVLRQAGGITGISRMQELARQLPTITRAQRLILTQLPFMREALMLIFRTKMLVGAGGPVAIGVILIYLSKIIKQIDRIQRQMIRDMASFEGEVREGLDLTHKEFDELGREIIGFATSWEQLQTRLKEAKVEGYLEGRWLSWDAIADYVSTKIGPFEPTVGWQPAANVPPPGTPLAPWLQGLLDWLRGFDEDSGHVYDPNLDLPADVG